MSPSETDGSDDIQESVARPRGAAEESKPVSDRKRRANQENAKKSTGPKTPRGKSNSRINALKHGFFGNPAREVPMADENPREYIELLRGVWDIYAPKRKPEEVEVQNLACLYWKRKRLRRYEDSVTRHTVQDAITEAKRRLFDGDHEFKMFDLKLQEAQEEIERTGQVPNNLRERVLAESPGCEWMWDKYDDQDKEEHSNEGNSGARRTRACALRVIHDTRSLVARLREEIWSIATEDAIAQSILPLHDESEKILLYEAAIDRFIERTMDRIERLQRERMRRERLSGGDQGHCES